MHDENSEEKFKCIFSLSQDTFSVFLRRKEKIETPEKLFLFTLSDEGIDFPLFLLQVLVYLAKCFNDRGHGIRLC